jgi:hypothetical protein
MNAKPACGPERDPEFFEEISRVFSKYPEAARRYAVSCQRLEQELLKIDFAKQVGVSRLEDGQIITEFRDRDAGVESAHHLCLVEASDGSCIKWAPE